MFDLGISFGTIALLAFGLFVLIGVLKGIRQVPQNEEWVVERFGRYNSIIKGGLNIIVPYIDSVAYKWDMRESPIDVPKQAATTEDNIRVVIDGVLYVQIVDAKLASYGSQDPMTSVIELAQTTMRAQIGTMALDQTLSERSKINDAVVDAVNEAAKPWGIVVKRYEINDIVPPEDMIEDMKRQARAEREARETVRRAEADRKSRVEIAEGKKREAELESEAEKIRLTNEAAGRAEAVTIEAKAQAEALELVGKAAAGTNGQMAVSFDLAKRAIAAQEALAKESTVVLRDGSKGAGDAADTVAQALAVAAAVSPAVAKASNGAAATGNA
jgi:regulator of protease activity HflC (stomatin/prohibitin superfamily)